MRVSRWQGHDSRLRKLGEELPCNSHTCKATNYQLEDTCKAANYQLLCNNHTCKDTNYHPDDTFKATKYELPCNSHTCKVTNYQLGVTCKASWLPRNSHTCKATVVILIKPKSIICLTLVKPQTQPASLKVVNFKSLFFCSFFCRKYV